MASELSDILALMRRQLGRNNPNDIDSNDNTLTAYINYFINSTMSDDVKLFENFGTMTFTINETNTTGVYTFNDVGASSEFVNISQEAFISLLDPVNNSVSWNRLPIYQDPGEFFRIWGINNDEILIPGYPTMMLYYGDEFTFRTIPETSYQVRIYGYKRIAALDTAGDPALPFSYWLRYVATGASYNYAMDYRYDPATLAQISKNHSRERKLMLTHTHNQIKMSRAEPKF